MAEAEETVTEVDSLVGVTIDGRYVVQEQLGRGGMGVVYAAEHLGLAKRVAIKFMLLAEPEAAVRFRREARVASKIAHDNVVQVIDVGCDAGRDYIVMEYVDGPNLVDVLEAGPIAPDRAISIARQMLLGLEAVHAEGLVHRDIKPGNVILAKRGGSELVKIMDFGLAKTVRTGDDTLTLAGRVVGTPLFMAPEALAGLDVDQRADLYAVGLVLFVMLAGDVPASPYSRADAPRAEASRRSLAARRPDLPAHVVAAVERALELSPRARFASAREFIDALDGKIVADKQSANTLAARPRARGPTQPRRRWPFIAAVAVAAVVVAVGGGIAYLAASSSAASRPHAPALDHGARAREAEKSGKLELAVAEYLEQLSAERGPDPLFHLGELSLRLGRRQEAIDYFGRYLAAAPDAPDRAVVAARIAELTPVAHDDRAPDNHVDAGTLSIDAGAHRTSGTAASHEHATSTTTAQPGGPRKLECRCLVDEVMLCSERAKTGDCTCSDPKDPNIGVCRGPLQYIGADGRIVERAQAKQTVCIDPSEPACKLPASERSHGDCGADWVTAESADDGATCSGYVEAGKTTGVWRCNWCRDETYYGFAGDPCTGASPTTGKPLSGKLGHCYE